MVAHGGRFAAGLALAALAGCVLLGSPPARATTAPTVERQATVVFGSRGITLSPRRVESIDDSTVIVVFRIRNTTTVGRRLVVGSYRSPVVPAGHTRHYSVAFVKNGPITCRSAPGKGSAFVRTLMIASA